MNTQKNKDDQSLSYISSYVVMVTGIVGVIIAGLLFWDRNSDELFSTREKLTGAEHSLRQSLQEKRQIEQRLEEARLAIEELQTADPNADMAAELSQTKRALIEEREALQQSLQEKRQVEQRLQEARLAIEELQTADPNADMAAELSQAKRALIKEREALQRSLQEKRQIEQHLNELLVSKSRNVDASASISWVGTWGGRYLCTSGRRREGLVRWQITSIGENILKIEELAARDNPEPNSYKVQLEKNRIFGLSDNGRYQIEATMMENGTLEGDWPGNPCGQVVVAKLF